MSKCQKCGESNLDNQTEIAMGAVCCPRCQSTIDQTGKVMDAGPIKQSVLESYANRVRKLAGIILSYSLRSDPVYINLEKAEEFLNKKNWVEALKLLKVIDTRLEAKADSGIPALKKLPDMFKDTLELCKKQDPTTIKKIQTIKNTLEKSEAAMERMLSKPQAWQVLSTPLRKLAELIEADYTLEKDPSYKKITDALVAAGRNDWNRAQAFLSQVGQAVETKEQGYKEKIPALRGLYETYRQALDFCKEQNPAAIEKITILVDTLKKTEKDVNKIMYPTRYQGPQ
jgi:hypothetical protein